MQRENESGMLKIGSKMPEFSLPDVTNSVIDNSYFTGAKASLVVFSCNHCPYVKGSDKMTIDIIKRYQPEGLKVVLISSNDASQYPEDSLDKMKQKSQDLGFSFPYLYDERQEVAKSFDAECTPEYYLFDQDLKLAYHGTINDSPRDASKVTKNYLAVAIEQVLAGKVADPAFVRPLGCSIKWKQAVF